MYWPVSAAWEMRWRFRMSMSVEDCFLVRGRVCDEDSKPGAEAEIGSIDPVLSVD